MGNKQKSLNLIEEADWETLLQMFGYLWEKEDVRDLIYSRVDMIAYRIEKKVDDKAEKELQDFIDFFSTPKIEKDYIEIEEMLKIDKKLDAMMEAKERKDEDYKEKYEDS